MNTQPTVFVVDDDPAVRRSLAEMLDAAQLTSRCYESAQEFLASYDASWPGCLVLDVRMPGMSGIELQEKLAGEGIHLPIIMITGHGDVPISVRAMKQGAIDFLEKPYHPHILLDSIREALKLDTEHRRKQARQAEVEARIATLTPGEQAVLERLVAGKINKVIALELDIGLRTVQARRSSLMKKLHVESRAALIELVAPTSTSSQPIEQDISGPYRGNSHSHHAPSVH